AYGAITVPPGVDSGLVMQVAVINGAKPGPVVAFVAGSHGTEYVSIVALQRFIGTIDPATLSGTVIVAPLLNVASLEQMVPHINPIDRKGMNASYPGNASGTQSERALALVAQQIVKPATVVVDLHGGDLDEDLRPYSYWIRTGNAAQDDASKALAMAFGLDMIIVRDVDATNPASARSLSGYALSLGKTTFVAEAGRAGMIEPDAVNALVAGAQNVLAALKMTSRVVKPLQSVVYVGADQRVRSDKPAMFYKAVERGSYVVKGQKVGWLTDYVGREMGDVVAPQSGVVTFIRPVPSAGAGATLVTVAQLYGESAPAYKKP
ncbi:MAG TPA: succinylglutamate desuccinylase/aspartoacylase family protein, partial [Gemmatimonadaceae bacterium]